MRVVLQRVKKGAVKIGGDTCAEIDCGLLGFVGFQRGDEQLAGSKVWTKMGAKTAGMRIFPDGAGKFNLSAADYGGEVLLVPQFTLYADCRKGRRPALTTALEPEKAESLFAKFVDEVTRQGSTVHSGVFGAEMDVQLVNWGPVTIILDSADF